MVLSVAMVEVVVLVVQVDSVDKMAILVITPLIVQVQVMREPVAKVLMV